MSSHGIIETMNLELTTNCPLRCPQCYCSLTGGKNIDLNVAIERITEAHEMGLQEVMLSGGETLCYPYLTELIRAISSMGVKANVALSGYRFTESVYQELLDAGIFGIFISLNGSTKEINAQTRDGFDLAMLALQLLKDKEFPNTTINWVMHSSNAEDFINILAIAEKYNVAKVTIMAIKPNSKKELNTVPSKEQMFMVRDVIRNHKGNTKILIESCFSPMLALIGHTELFGNFNVGKYMGCGAGRWGVNINVDGLISPCRHLDYFEKWDSIEEYWNQSPVLRKIRSLNSRCREPCSSCKFCNYCRHCLAINSKLKHDLFFGNECCPLAEHNK